MIDLSATDAYDVYSECKSKSYKSLLCSSGPNNPCAIYVFSPFDVRLHFKTVFLTSWKQTRKMCKQCSRANDQKIVTAVNIGSIAVYIIRLFYFRAQFWHLLVFKLSSFEGFIHIVAFYHRSWMNKIYCKLRLKVLLVRTCTTNQQSCV